MTLSTSPFLFHLNRGEPLTLEDIIVSSTSSDSGQPVIPIWENKTNSKF